MEKTGKIVTAGLALLAMTSLAVSLNAGKAIIALAAADPTFSATASNFVFTYTTPLTGTFTADIAGAGALKTLNRVSGTFTSAPVDAYQVVVTTSANATRGNLQVTVTVTALVNILNGTYTATSTSMVLTELNNGNTQTTTNVSSTGTMSPLDFTTLVITTSGSF